MLRFKCSRKIVCHIFNVSKISDLVTETVVENKPKSSAEIDTETFPENLPGLTRN